jgi:hypothetical protein
MKKQNQQYLATAGVLIVAVAAFWLFKGKKASQDNTPSPQPMQQTASPAAADPAGATASGVWQGKLMVSDNAKTGNLMLVTTDRTIYIKTSRDYSSLLNKNVRVTYSGTWQSFALGDITLN